MLRNLNKILIIFFIASNNNVTNGYNCFDDSESGDCSCKNEVCNCNQKTPINVRQGLSCTIVNSVDSCKCCCDKGDKQYGECGQGKYKGGCDFYGTTTKYIKGTSSCVTDNSLQPDLSCFNIFTWPITTTSTTSTSTTISTTLTTSTSTKTTSTTTTTITTFTTSTSSAKSPTTQTTTTTLTTTTSTTSATSTKETIFTTALATSKMLYEEIFNCTEIGLNDTFTDEQIFEIKEARQNETNRRIAEIANNTKAQIEKLKVKFEKEDRVKFYSALIAFIFLGSLITIIILVDLFNCIHYFRHKQPRKMKKKRQANKEIKKPVYVP